MLSQFPFPDMSLSATSDGRMSAIIDPVVAPMECLPHGYRVPLVQIMRSPHGEKMRVNYWALVLLSAVFGIASHAQTFTSLASLSDTTGASPTALGQQANGMLWVTTFTEGKSDCGTVFQATLAGTLSRFRNFSCTDGNEPQGLILGTDGTTTVLPALEGRGMAERCLS